MVNFSLFILVGDMKSHYRPEVDGLRALAVIPVILFHAGATWIQGGFLGVDVFFVISGFLITGILLKEFDSGRFSFVNFYERRIRRIAPALLVMLAIVTVLSCFMMVPYDLKNYGQSVVATIFSANNFLLYLTSGYWSTAADFKPLYHTWSLAVEEQYYIIAPVIMWVVHIISPKNLKRYLSYTLVYALIISFIYACYETSHDRELSFLMLPSRAWELAVGGIVAVLYEKYNYKKNEYLACIGVAMIIAGYTIFSGKVSHPGYETLTPVIGTCLYLFNSNSNRGVGHALSLKSIVVTGMMSYSLYLWHQPIFSFIRLYSTSEPTTIYYLISIPVIFIISFLSWRYVEIPFRRKESVPAKLVWSSAISCGLILSILGVVMHKTYGLQQLRPSLAYGGNPQDYVDHPKELKNKEFSVDGKKILVMGNSYARDFINIISTQVSVKKLNIVYFEGNCYESISNKNKLEHYTHNADIIIYSDNWGGETYNDSVDKLKSCYEKIKKDSRAKVIMPGTKNFGYNNNFAVHLSFNERLNAKANSINKYTKFNEDAKYEIGKDYLDLMGLIKDDSGKIPVFTSEGKFISYDTNHLTKYGAKFVGDIINNKTTVIDDLK